MIKAVTSKSMGVELMGHKVGVFVYRKLADLFLKGSYHSHPVFKNDRFGCYVEKIVKGTEIKARKPEYSHSLQPDSMCMLYL